MARSVATGSDLIIDEDEETFEEWQDSIEEEEEYTTEVVYSSLTAEQEAALHHIEIYTQYMAGISIFFLVFCLCWCVYRFFRIFF